MPDLNTTHKEMKVLQVKNVSLEDTGMYTCSVGTSVGVAYYSAWLAVYEGTHSSVVTLIIIYFFFAAGYDQSTCIFPCPIYLSIINGNKMKINVALGSKHCLK